MFESLKQNPAQLPKLNPKESIMVQLVGYSFLNTFLSSLRKEERKALVEISEVLSAFKEGKAEELEVVEVFLNNIREGGIEGLRGKKEILKEAYKELKVEKVEEFWRFIRSLAGAGKEESFSHFIRNKEAKQEITKRAMQWWEREERKEREEEKRKEEQKNINSLKEIAEKGKKKDLNEEELLFLLENDPTGGELLMAYEEEKERRDLEKKIKTGKGVVSEDL